MEAHVFVPAAGHDPGLVVHLHMDGADIVHVGFFAGVDGLPGQGEGAELAGIQPQESGGPLAELLLSAADGQGNVLNLDHGVTSLLKLGEWVRQSGAPGSCRPRAGTSPTPVFRGRSFHTGRSGGGVTE